MATRKQIGYSDGMERAKKGDTLGPCPFCGGPIRYAGTGRKPEVCRRKACQREASAGRMREWRARRAAPAVDVMETLG